MTHDEGDAQDLLINAVFAPLAAPAEVITVIAGEDDEGVFELTFDAEMIKKATDLLVECCNGGVVGAEAFTVIGLAHFHTGFSQ
jgi:hypothetical protein